MGELSQKFMDLPKWGKIGVWVGSIVLILIGWYFFFYADLQTKIEELNGTVSNLTTQVASEQRKVRTLPEVKKAVAKLEERLDTLRKELPNKTEIPSLLASISSLAKESGLDVLLFRPLPERKKEFFAEVPVAISLTGSFHQVATFFDEISRLDRIVNLNEIKMKVMGAKEKGKRVQISTECNAVTYRYLSPAERAPQAVAKSTGRRR